MGCLICCLSPSLLKAKGFNCHAEFEIIPFCGDDIYLWWRNLFCHHNKNPDPTTGLGNRQTLRSQENSQALSPALKVFSLDKENNNLFVLDLMCSASFPLQNT